MCACVRVYMCSPVNQKDAGHCKIHILAFLLSILIVNSIVQRRDKGCIFKLRASLIKTGKAFRTVPTSSPVRSGKSA